jgi:hypothetical protein
MTPRGALPGDPHIRTGRGLIRRTASTHHGVGTATYSSDLRYRFRLSRVWDLAGTRCVFVMLNPSTATEEVLDPTVTRCVNAARAWGYGSAEVVNLFAYRATDPALLRTVDDPVGAGNDRAIRRACSIADLVVVAWGVHGALKTREDDVVGYLRADGIELHSLGMTKAGAPRHPLYLPSGTMPQPWPSS